MPAGKERTAEVVDYAILHGDDAACKTFSLNRTTLDRYKRVYREHFGESADLLLKIKSRYSPTELQAIANGKTSSTEYDKGHLSFDGEEVCFGVMGDTHIGSKYTNESFVTAALAEFDKNSCTFFLHTGDVSEGMSGRDGHCYELTHIGYKAQKEAAIKLFRAWKKPSYFIAGNHDCLSWDTECLTQRGWVKYNELIIQDKILSYNIETETSQWDSINEILIQDRQEDLVQINAKGYQFLGTKGHRILAQKDSCPKWRYFIADYDKTTCLSFKVASSNNLSDYNINDDVLRVVAWLLTDGSIYRQKEEHGGRYCIHQSKDATNIECALTNAGLEYSVSERKRDITKVCGKILKKSPLNEKVFTIIGDSVYKIRDLLLTKDFPDWLYQISDRQYKIFMEVVRQANGSIHANSTIKAYAVYGTKKALDQLQILSIQHNDRAWLGQDNRGAWMLNITPDKSIVNFPYSKRKVYVPYDNKVWCLSVPMTNFMVRRNGTPYFTGNCWYKNKGDMGADIVDDICKEVPNSKYLGINEGSVFVNGVELRLWHGEDTGSYSTSYRLQKLVESLTGGSKPGGMFCGHTHKQGYFFERNVHIVSTGAIQSQSAWMRYKRLAAHTGFHVIKMGIKNKEIVWFEPRWYPFYQ